MISSFKYQKLILVHRQVLKYSRITNKNKSSLGLWHEDISTKIKLEIEKHWSEDVASAPAVKKNAETYYILPMFPYPSGNLHMGHVRVYSISDTIARFCQLDGKNVVHPIGWDAFGLPAENAAIEHNIPPHLWTQANIQSMKEQLSKLRFNFDWDRELSTCDPNYYKWTQYIFLKLFEKGLAYQCKAKVNWDPVDKTVLADEQVDETGCSWRSGAKVESKILTQWFIKTTQYAKKLYDGLDSNNLEDWKDIINLQRHWLGECNGVVATFELKMESLSKPIDVWTSDPYKFIHGEFLTISSNHIILQELDCADGKDLKCFNPVTNCEIPVYISDNVNYAPEKDVYIASPATDDEDLKLALALKVPIKKCSNAINIEEENQHAINIAKSKKVGGHSVSSKLKDWLISRQRYWGTPIPIIHCKLCGQVPVPYEDLPIKLPKVDYLETGILTLDKLQEWSNCKCPTCQSDAKRETDTMDTFVDSSWYYYRFLDPHNNEKPFDKNNIIGKTPVNIYIGGKEHAVLHLYYARFISYFLHSLGWTPNEEPFKKLVVQGMVMGQSYKLKSSGKYLHPDSVQKVGKDYKERKSGEPVLVQWEKMSKSKFNGENPERLISLYGCDTTRLLMLADVPPATSRRWSDETLPGVLNFQHRLWLTIRDFLNYKSKVSEYKDLNHEEFKKYESRIWEARNYFIATTTFHFKYTHKLSVGISRLQGLTNALRAEVYGRMDTILCSKAYLTNYLIVYQNNIPPEVIAKSQEFELALAALITMLAPVTPHFCSELWSGFTSAPKSVGLNIMNWENKLLDQQWPRVDDHYKLSFLCKVDGANRCDLKIKATDLEKLNSEIALRMMTSEESIAKRIKAGIYNSKFELYPGCRAILHIYTNRKPKIMEDSEKLSLPKV